MKDDLSCHLNPCFYPHKEWSTGSVMAYLSCSAPQPGPAQVGNYDLLLKETGWWSSIHNFNLKYLEDSNYTASLNRSFSEPFSMDHSFNHRMSVPIKSQLVKIHRAIKFEMYYATLCSTSPSL